MADGHAEIGEISYNGSKLLRQCILVHSSSYKPRYLDVVVVVAVMMMMMIMMMMMMTNILMELPRRYVYH